MVAEKSTRVEILSQSKTESPCSWPRKCKFTPGVSLVGTFNGRWRCSSSPTGIVLDVQGGKWHFSGNPRKQYKFFKKTSAFELREDEGKNLSREQALKINILLDRNEACFQPGGEHTPFIEHRFDTGDQPPIAEYPYRMSPVKKQGSQKENFRSTKKKIL
ncbi:retrovirus-related Pol polyprotein from transposon 297 [Trichonephila clavipes]|nr:retrovirus-related Pol polyprotein from transposon 297 [Trichonephila clavipes]